MAFSIVRQSAGFAIWHDGDGGYRVTGIDLNRDQVTSVLNRDCPKDGGQWCARATDAGVRYVTTGDLSRSTAMRHFRRLVAERDW